MTAKRIRFWISLIPILGFFYIMTRQPRTVNIPFNDIRIYYIFFIFIHFATIVLITLHLI